MQPSEAIGQIIAASHGEILKAELRQGYTIVSEAPWLDWSEWDRDTIISQCGYRVRLALLTAREPGHGAFTRLIARIREAKLMPIIVEPNALLIDWCLRHEFRSRRIAIGSLDQHVVWYPRISISLK